MRGARRSGFTLVEAVGSMVVAGLVFVAVGGLLSASRRGQIENAERVRATELATLLMSEILDKAFADPDGGTGLSIDAGETLGSRATYDDVDDYLGFSESPPRDWTGTEIPMNAPSTRAAVWAWSVQVDYVSMADASTVSVTPTACKRITVVVSRAGRALATLTGLKGNGRPS